MSTANFSCPPQPLRQRVLALRRRVHASMPWGYRVAALLVHLAADSLDAFGRTMYAEFIRAVVRGMPDTPTGKAAFDLVQDVHRRGPDALPSGYGKAFASRVYRILLAKFGDPEVAEDAMSNVLLRAARGKIHISNGSSLHEAESYIITAALNAARDILRAQGRRREVSLVRERDDDEVILDVEDPNSFKELEQAIAPRQMEKLIRDLHEVHPRAPEWLRARLEGDSGHEISDEWGTTPSYVSKWQRTYLPKIKRIVQHHLREARVAMSYDLRDAGT